ncbi:hypothetical protein SDC9_208192 [bioreactor metagenome]|uniref:Uncharacterized protein n=1 Tax=bioreactor metagenome TaxID=1076179 RepID=A0A645JJE1_9ZZZZ
MRNPRRDGRAGVANGSRTAAASSSPHQIGKAQIMRAQRACQTHRRAALIVKAGKAIDGARIDSRIARG